MGSPSSWALACGDMAGSKPILPPQPLQRLQEHSQLYTLILCPAKNPRSNDLFMFTAGRKENKFPPWALASQEKTGHDFMGVTEIGQSCIPQRAPSGHSLHVALGIGHGE